MAPPRDSSRVAVHPSATVDMAAALSEDVEIGPFAVLGPQVRLGRGCRVDAHAVLIGDTELGPDNRVGSHAVLGAPPQIRGLAGAGRLRIGRGNIIREHCTVHAGRPGSETRIGNENLLMVGSHVAHDCLLGDGIELANGVQLAGHVQVGDYVGMGGLAAAHQFVRIGHHAFVAAGAMVAQDVPPFSLAAGNRARIFGLNLVGLRRRGFSSEQQRQVGHALRELLRAPSLAEGLASLSQDLPGSAELDLLVQFVRCSTRGLCRLAGRRHRSQEHS